MFKLLLLSALIFGGISGYGQAKSDSTIKQLFENGEDQVEDSSFEEAIVTFKQIADIATPGSTSYCKAVFNIGYLQFILGHDSSAQQVFLQILESDRFHEMDKGGRGSGIMMEPYALYKHSSCEYLARISLRKADFTGALKYVKMFDKKYPYRHFCGNEIMSERIFTAEMYGKAYCGLHDTAKAIRVMLPYVFDSGLASNTDLLNAADSLLRLRYGKGFLVAQLNQAIEHIQPKTIKQGKYKYVDFQIFFLGVPISVPDPYNIQLPANYGSLSEIEKKKISAKASVFYSKIVSR